MLSTKTCKNNCCVLYNIPYVSRKNHNINRGQCCKAGVFFYDPRKKKILLVQSKGNLWGVPKGTQKKYESVKSCAIREVKEETGIHITENDLTQEIKIKNKAVYFVKYMDECHVYVQSNINGNDANGIGWINIKCLKQMIRDGELLVNQHCRVIVKSLLNIELPITSENNM